MALNPPATAWEERGGACDRGAGQTGSQAGLHSQSRHSLCPRHCQRYQRYRSQHSLREQECCDERRSALIHRPALTTSHALPLLPDVARSGKTEASSLPRQSDELPQDSSLCRAEVECYSPEGIATRAEHFPGEEVPQAAAMSHEQFTAIVERIAAAFPDGCTVHTDPPGYTLEEHVRRREQESRAAVRRAVQTWCGR
jgi:hypothetical protein